MAAAGVDILIPANQLAVVGVTEVFSKGTRLLSAIRRLKNVLATQKPDLLLLIDFPDFNLHLAATAKKMNIPVLYYISPQIWAWRAGRIKKIKARVDHMAVILPFEEDLYKKHNVPATFVGHPLLDKMDEHFHDADAVALQKPVIGLLPGSRDTEVQRLLPIMLKAAALLRKKSGDIRFVVSCAPSVDRGDLMNLIDHHASFPVAVIEKPVGKLFRECTLVIAASGTVTLEAALYGIPVIVTYIVSSLSYLLARLFVKVDHIGLANLIARKRIAPELIQKQVTPESISEAAANLIDIPGQYKKACEELKQIRMKLGTPGAAQRVADLAFNLMGKTDAV